MADRASDAARLQPSGGLRPHYDSGGAGADGDGVTQKGTQQVAGKEKIAKLTVAAEGTAQPAARGVAAASTANPAKKTSYQLALKSVERFKEGPLSPEEEAELAKLGKEKEASDKISGSRLKVEIPEATLRTAIKAFQSTPNGRLREAADFKDIQAPSKLPDEDETITKLMNDLASEKLDIYLPKLKASELYMLRKNLDSPKFKTLAPDRQAAIKLFIRNNYLNNLDPDQIHTIANQIELKMVGASLVKRDKKEIITALSTDLKVLNIDKYDTYLLGLSETGIQYLIDMESENNFEDLDAAKQAFIKETIAFYKETSKNLSIMLATKDKSRFLLSKLSDLEYKILKILNNNGKLVKLPADKQLAINNYLLKPFE